MKCIIVMGVSGVGKTTIGKSLAYELAVPFFDADDFHSSSSIKKMGKGWPLNDEDRWPWLNRLYQLLQKQFNNEAGAVLACSALKVSYRERLINDLSPSPELVFLKASPETIRKRVQKRKYHFMPPALIESQLATLEPPKNAIEIENVGDPQETVTKILDRLNVPERKRTSFWETRP